MKVFILINLNLADDPILGVYDSDLLAEKRKLYFLTIYPDDDLKIIEKSMQYLEMD